MNYRILRLTLTVAFLFVVGTIGYMLLEGFDLLDAAYMTTITIGTVGYGEVAPLSRGGRVFTIVLIIASIGVIAYSASVLGSYLFEAGLAGSFRRRRMERRLKSLENHIILVGYGRVGRSAANLILGEQRYDLVVLDHDPIAISQARQAGLLALEGDATMDEALEHAGIQRARGLIVSAGSDTTNLFVVLSARELNRSLRIVARASEAASEKKMKRAGANNVVQPHSIGGVRMATSLVKPRVTEVMDIVSADTNVQFVIEEMLIRPDSHLVGRTVEELQLRKRVGVTLIAVVRPNGDVVLKVDPSTRIDAHDQLVVMGTQENMKAFEALAGARQ